MEYGFCSCFDKLSIREALTLFNREAFEFILNPSVDQYSNTCFALGRLFGSFIGEKYINICGDYSAIEKMKDKMMYCGCLNGNKYLKKGKCPNENKG